MLALADELLRRDPPEPELSNAAVVSEGHVLRVRPANGMAWRSEAIAERVREQLGRELRMTGVSE